MAPVQLLLAAHFHRDSILPLTLTLSRLSSSVGKPSDHALDAGRQFHAVDGLVVRVVHPVLDDLRFASASFMRAAMSACSFAMSSGVIVPEPVLVAARRLRAPLLMTVVLPPPPDIDMRSGSLSIHESISGRCDLPSM